MAAVTGIPNSPDTDQIKSEIDAVLASEAFMRAPSLAQFLGYVCRKALNGESDQIKEYNIAVEAFGRQADFDQKEDAIVRVEAHRLRKRLKQYYETEGARHPIHILIPPGQYAPVFVVRPVEEPPAQLSEGDGIPASTELAVVRPSLIEMPAPVEPERRRFRPWPLVAAALALAAVSALIAVVLNKRSVPVDPGAAPSGVESGGSRLAGAADAGEEGLRIACGLTAPKYVDMLGNTWLGDRYFLGGQVLSSPAGTIQRARDAALFQTRREGDFRYDIPLEPGVYEMHLLFAERVFGAGNIAGGGETARLFHVFANGTPILETLDVISDAQGSNTADVRVFKDISPGPDGFLHLRFSPFKEAAFVNGIVILPGIPGKTRPVRLAAGASSAVRDASGRLWGADEYSLGGQVIARSAEVKGSEIPEVYRSERYGHFNYAVPVADGRHTVKLHFAETWFGPSKPSGGGEGSRMFDVHCNGATLLKNFDVFKAAGGSDLAVERTFRGLTPNAQGKLLLSFVPVRNYATLNAIEITAE